MFDHRKSLGKAMLAWNKITPEVGFTQRDPGALHFFIHKEFLNDALAESKAKIHPDLIDFHSLLEAAFSHPGKAVLTNVATARKMLSFHAEALKKLGFDGLQDYLGKLEASKKVKQPGRLNSSLIISRALSNSSPGFMKSEAFFQRHLDDVLAVLEHLDKKKNDDSIELTETLLLPVLFTVQHAISSATKLGKVNAVLHSSLSKSDLDNLLHLK